MRENKKKEGAYYTPRVLSEFLVKHIFQKYLSKKDNLTILEPSCGDGEFVRALNQFVSKRTTSFDLVDIDEFELEKTYSHIQTHSNANRIRKFHQDFLQFNFDSEPYDLIIGNPPYISKKYLSEEQIGLCKGVCKDVIKGEVKNIWPAFLIQALNNLTDDGIICYVLPSEILQVKYTKGLRELILDSFERVEIFAFNDFVFEDAEQDVVALIGIKKHENIEEHGVSFYQVDKLEDLKIPDYIERNFNVHREHLDKWTNYVLTDDELNTIQNLSLLGGLRPIKYYCEKAEVGIVTAANKYFIRPLSFIQKSGLNEYAKPIISRSNRLVNTVKIDQNILTRLQEEDLAVNLIHFENLPQSELTDDARAYIDSGEKEELHMRTKMTKRVNWYHVPSVWSSEALFCKRSHLYPKMLLNQVGMLATDSFYRVVTKEEYQDWRLVFSFYNSITLTLAELEGRFYGGGVLELIPSEFQNLLIPYSEELTIDHFINLQTMFENGEEINNILTYTDAILLPQISEEDLGQLREIRNTLFKRRTKSKEDIAQPLEAEALEVV